MTMIKLNTMAASNGNQYWKNRSKHGRNKKHTPGTLLNAAYEYFQHVDDNPIKVQKLFSNGNTGTLDVARPFTLGGFCLFANMSENTYRNYQKNDDFLKVTSEIDLIIYTNKFEGATAGIFNANIIARDLGLSDRQDVTSDGEKVTGFNIVITDKVKE